MKFHLHDSRKQIISEYQEIALFKLPDENAGSRAYLQAMCQSILYQNFYQIYENN